MKIAQKSQIKIGLISSDKVGSKMAGPGIRYLNLARGLSEFFSLTLFVPDGCGLKEKNFKIVAFNSNRSSSDLARKIKGFDVIIAQNLRPPLLYKIKKAGIRYIADLYDPLVIEVLEYTKGEKKKLRQSTYDFNFYSLALQLIFADHLLCASRRQFDFYTGVISGRKVLDPAFYDKTLNLEKFITLAPFGLEQKPPEAKNPEAIFQKFPQIKKEDKIIYWGGGIWNWFDPISVIKAIEILSAKRDDIKLFFLGMKHPNPKIKKMEMANTAYRYAKEKNLLDKFVFFNFDWTPYEERVDFLNSATIGISTHFDNVETRFSFRTRILDYLWAELPMILTRGDAFAQLCREKNLGLVVDFEKPSQIAAAAEEIIDQPALAATIKKNIREMKKDFYWSTISKSIAKIIKEELWNPAKFSTADFLCLTFDFYKAGLKKKLAK